MRTGGQTECHGELGGCISETFICESVQNCQMLLTTTVHCMKKGLLNKILEYV